VVPALLSAKTLLATSRTLSGKNESLVKHRSARAGRRIAAKLAVDDLADLIRNLRKQSGEAHGAAVAPGPAAGDRHLADRHRSVGVRHPDRAAVGRRAWGVAVLNRQLPERHVDLVDGVVDVEHAIDSVRVDDRAPVAGAIDDRVACDVEVARRVEVLVRAGDRQVVDAGSEQDRVGAAAGRAAAVRRSAAVFVRRGHRLAQRAPAVGRDDVRCDRHRDLGRARAGGQRQGERQSDEELHDPAITRSVHERPPGELPLYRRNGDTDSVNGRAT